MKLYGASAADHLVKRVAKQIDARGTVDVTRHGFDDQNVKGAKVTYFRPAHGLTPELEERYRANTLTITRQVASDPKSNKTLDIVPSVNGIPVATAELIGLPHQPIQQISVEISSSCHFVSQGFDTLWT